MIIKQNKNYQKQEASENKLEIKISSRELYQGTSVKRSRIDGPHV